MAHRAYLHYDQNARRWLLDVPTAPKPQTLLFPRDVRPPALPRRDEALRSMGLLRFESNPWTWREDQSGDVSILTCTATVTPLIAEKETPTS